jgi:3'-phosphoadenosine 5'-phosphosulfate sulfotransferase (PAPS reductase)/FAD synthetase
MLQPWSACCAKLRFQPILDYLATFGVSLFVHGQRLSDRGGFNAVSGPDAEVEICAPLREWSERDVFDYIERHGVELLEQYSMGIRDSLECSNCPARADGSADSQEALFEYMVRR